MRRSTASSGRFDLVVANILANTLVELAPALVRARAGTPGARGRAGPPGGRGARDLRASGCGFGGGDRIGDWVRLDFRRS